MTYTYVLSTDVGKVRLMIPDRIEIGAIFQDAELEAFLEIEGGRKEAAALAIETIATDEALVQKVMTNQGLSTNGAATAKALMDRAAQLRKQAAAASDEDLDGMFDFGQPVYSPFSARDAIWNEALRG